MDYQPVNFVVDRVVQGRAYPTLAKHQAEPYTAEWQEFVRHWPYTIPCELIDHCIDNQYPFTLWTADENYPVGSYYLIGIGFFDFSVDYFGLLPELVRQAVQEQRLTILFYYHEGDDPDKIKLRLDALCLKHRLDIDCYKFVSGNTRAMKLINWGYFPDHELLYRKRNQLIEPLPIHNQPRSHDFTVLSRTHKWWRATVMTDLYRNGLLENSYWSYNTNVTIDELEDHNPIKTEELNIEYAMSKFLSGAPYTCDELDSDDHNNHARLEPKHYSDSYCHIILETMFDTDQSGGAFFSEKTFKPIKHGQPFIMVGAPHSINRLQDLGYRTFDHVIDHSYDRELDNTKRWQKIFKEICRIKSGNMHELFESCREDIEHNQRLFVGSKYDRLNILFYMLGTMKDFSTFI